MPFSLHPGVLTALVVFAASFAASLAAGQTPPNFGSDYFVSGTLNLPYGEISEPFKAWVSGSTKMSRVDYYGTEFRVEMDGELGYLL